VPLEILVHVQVVSQPAATGRPIGLRTIGPALFGLGEGLAGRDVPVPSHTSDFFGVQAQCTLTLQTSRDGTGVSAMDCKKTVTTNWKPL
jgi:hypothetical protein